MLFNIFLTDYVLYVLTTYGLQLYSYTYKLQRMLLFVFSLLLDLTLPMVFLTLVQTNLIQSYFRVLLHVPQMQSVIWRINEIVMLCYVTLTT